jgi:hypothetical protein
MEAKNHNGLQCLMMMTRRRRRKRRSRRRRRRRRRYYGLLLFYHCAGRGLAFLLTLPQRNSQYVPSDRWQGPQNPRTSHCGDCSDTGTWHVLCHYFTGVQEEPAASIFSLANVPDGDNRLYWAAGTQPTPL